MCVCAVTKEIIIATTFPGTVYVMLTRCTMYIYVSVKCLWIEGQHSIGPAQD